MGAWGVKSVDCDSVQDELDYFRSAKAARTEGNLSKALDKIKVDKYDSTLFVGVVVGLLNMKVAVPKKYIKRAAGDAAITLFDHEYFKNWNEPEARRKALTEELELLKANF